MNWLHHPSYQPVLNYICELFQKKANAFTKGRHFIFLCGGVEEQRRNVIKAYLEKHGRDDSLVFLADDVWEILSRAKTNLSALEVEEFLANLSDVIIIIVESPGTFTELGAFTMSDAIRSKLILLLDKKYRNEKSFINLGPVSRFDKDRNARFRPAIQTDFDVILNSVDELDKRLERLGPPRHNSKSDLKTAAKFMLHMICDLVSIVGPVTDRYVHFHLRRIGFPPTENQVFSLLALAASMKLLLSFESEDGRILYYRPVSSANTLEYHYRPPFDLSKARARVASVLLQIPGAREDLVEAEHARLG